MKKETKNSKSARTEQRVSEGELRELRQRQRDIRKRADELKDKIARILKSPSGSDKERSQLMSSFESELDEATAMLAVIREFVADDTPDKSDFDIGAGPQLPEKLIVPHTADHQIAPVGGQPVTVDQLRAELGNISDQVVGLFSELERKIQQGVLVSDPDKMGKLNDMQERLGRAKSKETTPRLDVPEGTTWDSVIIRFISDDAVEIRAGKRSLGAKNFAELGFSDARKGGKCPNKLWELLSLLAKRRGELPTGVLDTKENNFLKKRVSDLGIKLKLIFGIKDNPFHPYRKARSYRVKFVISKREEADDEPEANDYKTDLQEQEQARRTQLGKKYDRGIAADIKKNRSSDESD
jgi:hypothetical protein